MIRFILSGWLLLAVASCAASQPPAPADWLSLREPFAYDGDTLYATAHALPAELANILIRVRNVDAPEIRGKCDAEKAMAIEARDFVIATVTNGAPIQISDIAWDKWGGRVLATVYVNGHDLGEMLIAQGLGRPYDGGKRDSWC